jgi:anti-sigma factor RsiW
MECEDVRAELGEWRQGRLSGEEARSIERHLTACPECRRWEEEERAVTRLLSERFVRHSAPPRLKLEILQSLEPRPPYSWWWIPASALLMVLLLLPMLTRSTPGDPLQPFIRAVYSEHARSLLWGAPQAEAEAVPVALPRLMLETGIGLSWVFTGDDELQLKGLEPVVLQGQRGLAFHYNDPQDHLITYVVLPGQGLTLPEGKRVQVDRFRPMLSRIDGFAVFVWKQEGLACFLIADLVSQEDLARFQGYFVKIRSTTEPFLIN